jgi:hypothetical protein
MKRELWWRGANTISNFDHHNKNGGAVDMKKIRIIYTYYRAP